MATSPQQTIYCGEASVALWRWNVRTRKKFTLDSTRLWGWRETFRKFLSQRDERAGVKTWKVFTPFRLETRRSAACSSERKSKVIKLIFAKTTVENLHFKIKTQIQFRDNFVHFKFLISRDSRSRQLRERLDFFFNNSSHLSGLKNKLIVKEFANSFRVCWILRSPPVATPTHRLQ